MTKYLVMALNSKISYFEQIKAATDKVPPIVSVLSLLMTYVGSLHLPEDNLL